MGIDALLISGKDDVDALTSINDSDVNLNLRRALDKLGEKYFLKAEFYGDNGFIFKKIRRKRKVQKK